MGEVCSATRGDGFDKSVDKVEKDVETMGNPFSKQKVGKREIIPVDPEFAKKLKLASFLVESRRKEKGASSSKPSTGIVSPHAINISESVSNNGGIDEIRNMMKNLDTIDFNQYHEGKSALYWAVSNGNLAVVKILLSVERLNPNIGCMDFMGITCGTHYTPLYEAVKNDSLEIVDELLNCPKVDVNMGYSVLMHRRFEKKVVELGIQPELPEDHEVSKEYLFISERSPLFLSLDNENQMMTDMFLKKKELDIRRGRVAPVHVIAKQGDIKALEGLLNWIGKHHPEGTEEQAKKDLINQQILGVVPMGDDDKEGVKEKEEEEEEEKDSESKKKEKRGWVPKSTPLHVSCAFGRDLFADELIDFYGPQGLKVLVKDEEGKYAIDLTDSDELGRKLRRLMNKKRKRRNL